jgi:hypothetical protein
MTPNLSVFYLTVYVYTVTYSHRERGGGGENGTREKVRGAKVYKAVSKIPA